MPCPRALVLAAVLAAFAAAPVVAVEAPAPPPRPAAKAPPPLPPGVATAAAAAAAPTSASGDPLPAMKNADLFEKSLTAAQQGLEQYGQVDDPAALRRIAGIGYRVAAQSGFTDLPITFHYIDMPEPNALALPGGQVFVTRGMYEMGLTDDMLAGLLGHEVAHVVLHHGVKMEKRATLLNILSQAAVIGVLVSAEKNRSNDLPNAYPVDPYYGAPRENRTGDLVQGAAATSLVVSELLLRSYSRDFEDQADEEGQRWAAAAGYDPHGTEALMTLMRERLPEKKEYGYWRTHPFFDTRISAAEARAAYLKRQSVRGDDPWREATQKALLGWLATQKPAKPEKERRPPTGPDGRPLPPTSAEAERERPANAPLTVEALVKQDALLAWPQGAAAETLRLERLHAARDAELARPELSRDYGRLLHRYADEIAEVAALTPQSPFLATVRGEREALQKELDGLYPKAQAVLRDGVYETPFLEAFASNWPDRPEAARVALLLGDAYSRTGRQADAVGRYLAAWNAAPESPEGQRAATGLRNLAPILDRLAALQELATEPRDAELQKLAAARLDQIAGKYGDLENGAEYLRRFPSGSAVERVRERLDFLANQLYSEVVLYQAVGEHVKAMEGIQQILTHAPLSPAADRLRESAVVPG